MKGLSQRLKAPSPLWLRVFLAAALAALLAGCLLDHTLITPSNAYDPKVALSRDSLSRFDTVEILLVDPDDPTVAIRLWKGPLSSTDGLPPHLAGDGQTLVYLVQGTKTGRGRCYTERVTQEGAVTVLMDTCAQADPGPVGHPVPKFLRDNLAFGNSDTLMAAVIGNIKGSGDTTLEVTMPAFGRVDTDGAHSLSELPSEGFVEIRPGSFIASKDTLFTVTIAIKRNGLAAGDYYGLMMLNASSKTVDSAYLSFTVPKPDPEPKPAPVPAPKLRNHSVDLGETDTVFTMTIDDPDTSGSNGKAVFRLLASLPSIHAPTEGFRPGKVTEIPVPVVRGDLKEGRYQGAVLLLADTGAVDTVFVFFTVPKPVVQLSGDLVSWSDSATAQPGLTVTLDGAQPGVLSDAKGAFSFPNVELGPHVLSVTGDNRLGTVDTFTLSAKGSVKRRIAVAPAAGFGAVPQPWLRQVDQTAMAGGYGLLLSSDFNQEGFILAFPLDNPSTSLQKIIPQGNNDGDPDFPEYFEPGEVVGDSAALFIAYPDASRLGRVGSWKSAPQTVSASLSFEPGGLLLDGTHLLALGRLADSTLILADFSAADLSLNRLDTLKGFYWDGVLPSQRTPKLAAWGGSYYAVDGNSPNAKGHLIRIGRDNRKVEGSKELADAATNGLAIYDGMIYVTSMSSSGKQIRVFDPALSEAGSIAAGTNTDRIAFATQGKLRGYGFATTDDNAVLVLHPLSKKPVGKLSLPGTRPGRSVSVDGLSGNVLVSDGDTKLYKAQF